MFWVILPYIIAGGLLAVQKRMSETKNLSKTALQIGREITTTVRKQIEHDE